MKVHNNDDLEKCTKAELVQYIKETHWLRPFQYSVILFKRWETKSDCLAIKRDSNHLPTDEEAQNQDDLASQFNAETDTNKRISIINKMKPYQRKMDNYIKMSEALDKEEKALNKLYDSIDIQRQKER